jgi:dihydropteroate synthase
MGEMASSIEAADAAGVGRDRIVIDPGLGFSKTPAQSLEVLDHLAAFLCFDRPILVGPSRKRFLGVASGRPAEDRDRATAIACVLGFERGARLFRVHDVAMVREALKVAAAVRGG